MSTATVVNIHHAKTHLSQLLEQVEQGREVVIARAGHPIARLVPLAEASAAPRIGVARGCFEVPDDIDAHHEDVARLFRGEAS